MEILGKIAALVSYSTLSYLGIKLVLLFLRYDERERHLEPMKGKWGACCFERPSFCSFYWGKTEKARDYVIISPILFIINLFSKKLSRLF